MSEIIEINEVFENLARKLVQARAQKLERTDSLNKDELEATIGELYGAANLSKPQIVICDSPWQMLVMPTIFLCQSKESDQPFFLTEKSILDKIKDNLCIEMGEELTEQLIDCFERNSSKVCHPGKKINRIIQDLQNSNSQNFSTYMSKYFERGNLGDATRLFLNLNQEHVYGGLHFELMNYLTGLSDEVSSTPVEEQLQTQMKNYVYKELGYEDLNKAPLSPNLIFGLMFYDLLEVISEINKVRIEYEQPWLTYKNAVQLTHYINPFENICFVSDFPEKLESNGNRLHCPDGPAIQYRDGLKLYFWNGLRVPSAVIEDRDMITADSIIKETNAELRRVMTEVITPERFIQESGMKAIQEDEFGALYKIEDRIMGPLVMVRVVNKTAEPDGSFKQYWLRVPPHMRTARQAVAWSFDMSEAEYYPVLES